MEKMLTSNDLLRLGVKPGELFGRILKECSTEQEALVLWNNRAVKTAKERIIMLSYSTWEWLCNAEFFSGMCSREFPGQQASNSEKRRWLENHSVKLNGKFPGPDDIVERETWELVFFPKSPSKITMV